MIELREEIKDLIIEFRHCLDDLLSNKLHGLYLYNSVAMGKFEPSYSDIDFVVLLTSDLTDNELEELGKLHKRLSDKFAYASRLDGMYLQYSNIGKPNNGMKPYAYAEGPVFHNEGYYDVNNVTWWSLKVYGLAIDSPSIKEELSSFSWNNVLNTMSFNLNDYWASKLENSSLFLEDLWVEFGVVTLSRIVYTLEQNCLVSKTEACNHILNNFDEWEDIVKEALAIRNQKSGAIIEDVNMRKDRAIEFISYMINHGNMILQSEIE